MSDARSRLIVALDLPSVAEAQALVHRLGDAVVFYKIGYRLAFAGGLDLARRLTGEGHQVFLDLKLHDIGNTVREGVESLVGLGATFLTVHAYPQTVRAAIEGRGDSPLRILAVTALTSYDDSDLAEAGYALGVGDLVRRRAAQASALGVDGIVCSAREARLVRAAAGPNAAIVTPGIRPAAIGAGDQKRTMTPGEAILAGATHLVVGRPILESPDPRGAAAGIIEEIAAASSVAA